VTSAALPNGVEHANFFEQRATEYSRAATRGDWNQVWDGFDKRQKAKAGTNAANEDAGGICLALRAWLRSSQCR
jgi:ribonucleoside-diphosphate reductase beta chain